MSFDFKRSPYLESHSKDAVKWNLWSEDTLKKAREENKPLFISIGYYTCHWCHVMQEICFNDEEIADMINENFIPIIVDREERPDIDDFYMHASQIINGSGGWPLNVFAMPDGKPFYVTTFLYPRRNGEQPGMVDVIESLSKIWKEERGRIIETSDEITSILVSKGKQKEEEVTYDQVNEILDSIFDRRYGGFGSSPKFPNFPYLHFLMAYDRYNNIKSNRFKVEKTLDNMLKGGIYDQVGSGLHRYATDEKWEIPHFEKMLYDQGLLIETLMQFYDTYRDEKYMNSTRDLIDFIMREMRIGNLFISAIDSDLNREEGLYYLWNKDEISSLLGEETNNYFRNFFDLSVKYNDKVILKSKDVNINEKDRIRIKEIKKILRKEREKKGDIKKDDKIVLSWNAIVLKGMIHFSFYDNSITAFINDSLHELEEKFWKGDEVYRTVRNGEPGVPGTLEDYSYLLDLFLDMYNFTIEESYLNKAIKLLSIIKEKFFDDSDPGFFVTQKRADIPVVRGKGEFDASYPSGTSILFHSLFRLAIMTGYQEMNSMAYAIEKKDMHGNNLLSHISLITFSMEREKSFRLEMRKEDVPGYKKIRDKLENRFYFLPVIGDGINICNMNSCIAHFDRIDEVTTEIKKL